MALLLSCYFFLATFQISTHLDPDTVQAASSKVIPLIEQTTEPDSVDNNRLYGDLSKESLEAIKQVYDVYVASLASLLEGDQLETERLLTACLEMIQGLLEEVPEVQQNKRFQLLYRSVINEYNEFYGISETSEDEGEIFSVITELFNDESEDAPGDFRIPENILAQKFQVPLIRNQYVNNHLFYLAHRRPEIMEKWLQRSEFYFPMMLKIFKEENVPTELVHLSMIESGLIAHAKSKAKAVGLWQFIVATGAMYGLEVNYWIDERRDPEKATRAAARHLRDLYNVWGDWHLALANYNVSPRRMKWAVAKSKGVRNYWVIYPYLPKETRGYVPSYIATTLIATNAEQFGFKKNYGGSAYQYDVVDIEGSVRIDVLARCAGIPADSLRFWNPELIRWATPPGKNAYPLKLPAGLKEQFLTRYKEISDSDRGPITVHIVKKGETLGKIATRYGTSVKDLYAANPSMKNAVGVGQEVVIPVPPAAQIKISANMPSGESRLAESSRGKGSKSTPAPVEDDGERIVYKVKSGDTISGIADAFGVPAWKIRSWNGTTNMIRAGQKLVIYKNAPVSKAGSTNTKTGGEMNRYTVRTNDSLYDIARRHNMSVEDLKRINNLKSNNIQPGQVLYVSK
jgi:membrane-bound lytic murein transglycosylase D